MSTSLPTFEARLPRLPESCYLPRKRARDLRFWIGGGLSCKHCILVDNSGQFLGEGHRSAGVGVLYSWVCAFVF